MNKICIPIIMMFVVNNLVAGCTFYHSLMRPQSLIEHSQYVVEDKKNNKCKAAPNPQDGALDLDTFKFSKDDKETAYNEAVEDEEARNRLQDVLLERSDTACGYFLDNLYARVAARKTFLKTTSLLSSTAAAIVTGDDAQKILAGLGGVALGTDSIIDAEIMQNQMSTLLITQINTIRNQIKGEIYKRRIDEKSSYSVDAAILDVGRYHKACSFTSAITALTKNSSRTFITRSEIDKEIKDLESKKEKIIEKIGELNKIDNAKRDQAVLDNYHKDLEKVQKRIDSLNLQRDITTD